MFNPAAFMLDALFNKPKENATWRDVYLEFAVLTEVERVELLDQLKSEPVNLPEHLTRFTRFVEDLTKFIVQNIEDPERVAAMISADDAGLINLATLEGINREKSETVALVAVHVATKAGGAVSLLLHKEDELYDKKTWQR